MKTSAAALLMILVLAACEKGGPDAASAGSPGDVVVATGAPAEWERQEHIARGAARGACEDDLYHQCHARHASLVEDAPVEPSCTSRPGTHEATHDSSTPSEYRCTVRCSGRCGPMPPPAD